MNQTKSSNEKTGIGIVNAMRPLWRVGIPATAALATALAVVFAVALDGCSGNKGNKTNVTASSHTSLPSGAGAGITTLPDLSSQPVTTAKKSRPVVQRLSTVGYLDSTYGVSFRYPRTYTMLSPEKVKLDQSMEQAPMNFVQPGGVSLATIGWANGPATSLFNVSVNKGLSEQQCQQFAVPDASDVASNSPVDPEDDSIPVKVSLHGTDFTRVENGTEQSDVRYYHHFENGACYEFVMAVEESKDNTKPVNHFELFDKLERIMATVKIKPEAVPAMTAGVPSSVPSASTNGSNPR
jgi:hypothetical protein